MCGFDHSTFVRTPDSFTGFVVSNSAVYAWCANAAAGMKSNVHANKKHRVIVAPIIVCGSLKLPF